MKKNELTKVLFPYAMEVAKTVNLSEEDLKIITGDVGEFRLSDIVTATEFMNSCVNMFIQDVVKNFTIEDIAKFINTAFNVTAESLPDYAVMDFMSRVAAKKGKAAQSTNDNHEPHRSRQNQQVHQMSFFDNPNVSYIVDERPGTARVSMGRRTVTKNISRARIIGNVILYYSIDELKRNNPNAKDKDIYRVAGMIPGKGEFNGVPPMYYVSTNGKNPSVARKSYREFAHKYYESACKAYKNMIGYVFGYSFTCKPAYKKNK